MRNKAPFISAGAMKEMFSDYHHYDDFLSFLIHVVPNAGNYYSVEEQTSEMHRKAHNLITSDAALRSWR